LSELRRTAHATVSLVIDVETGTWGPECTIDQATRQAREEAIGRVMRLLTQATQSDAQLTVTRDTLRGIRLARVAAVSVRLTEEAP
jgi:hypothetical protein